MRLGPKYQWRVSDYCTWRAARARCVQCRREWDVDLRRFPLDRLLIGLEPALKCSACGAKGLNYFIASTNRLRVVKGSPEQGDRE
jgi:hypothetical protein